MSCLTAGLIKKYGIREMFFRAERRIAIMAFSAFSGIAEHDKCFITK